MPLLTKQHKVWSNLKTPALPAVNPPVNIVFKPARAERHYIVPEPQGTVTTPDGGRHDAQQVVSNQMLIYEHKTDMGVARQLS